MPSSLRNIGEKAGAFCFSTSLVYQVLNIMSIQINNIYLYSSKLIKQVNIALWAAMLNINQQN